MRNDMKTLATMVLVLGARLISSAEDSNKILFVAASVRSDPGMPPVLTLIRAEGIASGIFAKTGVSIIWHTGLAAVNRGEKPIWIDIDRDAPEAFHRGSLAYARPFEDAHVTIFWDRLTHGTGSATETGLLAHVLAHEIMHILQRTGHHSREGIMKAYWTREDIVEMVWKPLSFDPEDIRLLRLGLAARNSAAQRVLPGPGPYRLH